MTFYETHKECFRPIKIEMDAYRTRFICDGHDITHMVSNYTIQHNAGEYPTVHVEMYCELHFDGDVTVEETICPPEEGQMVYAMDCGNYGDFKRPYAPGQGLNLC